MKPFWKVLSIVCVLAAGSGFYWWKTQSSDTRAVSVASEKATKGEGKGKGKGAGKRGSGGPVSVTTLVVGRQPMPVVIDAVGTVESEHSVAVRAQVNGVLQAV